jgi:hypothetical protein
MKNWILLFALVACANNARQVCRGIVAKNDLWIPEYSAKSVGPLGIAQTQFNEVLDRVERLYASEFGRRGASFSIERRWSDGTVNAFADQSGQIWRITMYGGFARYPGMTYDAFAAVACHEVGHHLGGAPKYDTMDWASAEGQADYYAMAKCLKRLFENDDNARLLAGRRLDPAVVHACEAEHASQRDRLVCVRASLAGASLSGVFRALEGGGPALAFVTPDGTRVAKTVVNHPLPQCRLDTYFQGALCRVNPWSAASDTNPTVGYCADSRAYTRGLRPRCWYAP